MMWKPIETADRPLGKVRLARFAFGILVKERVIGHWHEGDVDAGWAYGDADNPRPLGFEPTHWQHLPGPLTN